MPVWQRLHRRFERRARGTVARVRAADEVPVPALKGQRIAVIVEGHRGDALERILAMVKDRSAAAGVAPVIVTISADLDRIAAAGLPFEVLVDPDGEAVDDLPMRHRLEQQMEAIVRLWQPINVIAFVTPTRARLKHLLEEALRAGRVRPPPGGA